MKEEPSRKEIQERARAKPADVAGILETLVTLGRAHKREGGLFTR